ncbi:MAG: SMP-30/gluconolactonase/LRE family protein [Lachnospiraceae bacterium]|nr:SMP-30/gluconolactonase/LRE family protein [Lachnospiraceae bacterium]
MKKYQAVLFDRQKFALGESPFYDARFKRYSWVDIINGELWTLRDGEKKSFSLGQPIGAAIPLSDSDGFYLAAMDGLYIYENGEAKLLCPLNSVFKNYWRSNDAKTDPFGRIFFGASVADDDHEAEGALFCYDKGKITCLQDNTKIANGMAWSSDRKSFFFSDSLEYAVFKYDYDPKTGMIGNRRKLFSVENGVPDGMCIDLDDNLWVAIWGGNRIEKRDGKTGELLAEIEVPAKQTSSCNFLDDGKTLFITSAGVGLDGESDGCLFTCEVD